MPFVLGRPFGVPNDPEFQHHILDAALELLARTDGPLMVDCDATAPDIEGGEDTWVCPVSFSKPAGDQSMADTVKAEAALLRPWYEKHLADHGSTTRCSDEPLDSLIDFLFRFTTDDLPTEEHRALRLKQAAEDLKAFYNEAATSQPGTASAKSIENWYWQETQAGQLIRQIKDACSAQDDNRLKITAGFLLVPGAQSGGDH